jgi:general secretion pathway protein M
MKQLTQRERIILGGGGVALLLVLLYGLVFAPWRAAEARLDRRIASYRQQLTELDRLTGHYRQLAAEAAAMEGRLARSGNVQLVPFLEGLVDGIAGRDRLAALRPQPVPPGGSLREERVELQLQRLRLDQVVRLLQAIDSAEACLATRQLRLRQRFDDPALLDAELTVAAYGKLP